MQKVFLSGKSNRGKSKLREARLSVPGWDGKTFRILETRESVQFSDIKGQWLLVEPLSDSPEAKKHSRWVHSNNDAHFIVSCFRFLG